MISWLEHVWREEEVRNTNTIETLELRQNDSIVQVHVLFIANTIQVSFVFVFCGVISLACREMLMNENSNNSVFCV